MTTAGESKIESLLAEMTLSEKIGQMVQISHSEHDIPEDLSRKIREGRVGSLLNVVDPQVKYELQRISVQESRLGIPLLMARDVIHGFRTIFPIPLGQAAAWDPGIAADCAAIAAEEAAAEGYHWTFAPMLDIARDPRWGRIAEGFGEDPYLAAQYAAATVRGFQGESLSAPGRIASCAKHFAAYGAAEGGRDYDAVNIPENLLRDVYLPPFKAALDAGAATLMAAFNEINGVPATGNYRLLRDILRSEWNFDGVVVSDWKAVEEMVEHGFCEDAEEAAARALAAGIDIEMQSSAYERHLEKLIQSGSLSGQLVDEAVRRILRLKFQLGLFAKMPAYPVKPPEAPSRTALDLAKTAALKSVVLLKNDKRILPLSRKISSLAVIGPLADDPYEVLGTWNRDGRPEDTVTPLAALRSFLGPSCAVRYAAGLEYARSRDTRLFPQAVEAARASEAVLLFAGEEAILSGEGHSRAHLGLPGAQDALIREIAATGKPLVLVVFAGRPLTIGAISRHADALLYAWHPGTMTGPALAELIFGIESPSGKLPVTFPQTEGQIPIYYARKNTGRPPEKIPLTMIDDIPRRARQSSLGDASRYLDIGYLPLYPFGYGLSYTEFSYSRLRLSSPGIRRHETLSVSVDLTNTGEVEAEEVVQLYVRDLAASLTRPVRELKGFQRVRLKAGETATVEFRLPGEALGFHNSRMEYVVEPGRFHLWVGGSSHAGLMSPFSIYE